MPPTPIEKARRKYVKEYASKCAKCVKKPEMLCNGLRPIGVEGDPFTILMEACPKLQAKRVADREAERQHKTFVPQPDKPVGPITYESTAPTQFSRIRQTLLMMDMVRYEYQQGKTALFISPWYLCTSWTETYTELAKIIDKSDVVVVNDLFYRVAFNGVYKVMLEALKQRVLHGKPTFFTIHTDPVEDSEVDCMELLTLQGVEVGKFA